MKALILVLLLHGIAAGQAIERKPAASIDSTATSPSSVTISNLAVGGVIFSSTPADGRLSVDASNLFWDDANNRLGIGTNSPTEKLHISSGTLKIEGTGASFTTLVATITKTMWVGESGVAHGVINGPADIYINIDSNNDESSTKFVVSTNRIGTSGGTELMRLTDAGLLGIGATPATKLHVSSGTLTIDGTGGAFILSGSGTPVTISTWTATYTGGSAHVCVNDSGVLFVSEAACP